MDLIRCTKLCFVYFLIAINAVLSRNICTPGLTMPGYTFPKGDIIIEEGKPLDIVCVIYDNVASKLLPDGSNASSLLSFARNNGTIPQEMIEVLNATSIKLHIDRPPKVLGDKYTCLVNGKDIVCMNQVTVGIEPRNVTDFNCISYNYENLTCTWTPPQNFVKTEYELYFSKQGRAYHCPYLRIPTEDDIDQRIVCVWTVTTTPLYRQTMHEFNFTLIAKNPFGVKQMNKTMKHFENVLSGPPENLTAISTTPSSIYLYWMVPSAMILLPVHHRIMYQCEYGAKAWHFGALITNDPLQKDVKFNLTNLKNAHALCDIRVSIRSAVATDEAMWSRNSSITVRTSSKIPDEPPKTDIGSFELVALGTNMMYREVFIYWHQILEEQKNGPEFTYEIVCIEDPNMKPVQVLASYAKFTNISISKNYSFRVWSKNSRGRSLNSSTINITKRIREPLNFMKVEFGPGRYELMWEMGKTKPKQVVSNYTIFWCGNSKDRPYQCTGRLNWKVVEGDRNSCNMTVPITDIYQFAISANTETGSSGMLWAACTIIHNRNGGKIKDVAFGLLGPTFIEVAWKLDCSDRIGSVEGYVISYCEIVSPTQTECKGGLRNVTINGSTIDRANITNLTPYRTYMLNVAVVSKHSRSSQQSDPFFQTTLETVPSSPPINLTVTEVTNSSISLKWLPPPSLNGVLQYYTVKYNDRRVLVEKQTNVTLKNLSSYGTYAISVSACTNLCSEESAILNVTTKMGYPSQIKSPLLMFQNVSLWTVTWDKPINPRGKLDYYQVKITQMHRYENVTLDVVNVTDRQFNINGCDDGGKYDTFFTTVRAVNIINGTSFKGPWSNEMESYCHSSISYGMYGLVFLVIAFFVAVAFFTNWLYKHCKRMRDVEVKLPPGLHDTAEHSIKANRTAEKHAEDSYSPADQELLLVKMSGRHSSGDSSGCSSGHESATSSLASGTHISATSDSGTEQASGNYCHLGVDQKIADSAYVPIVAEPSKVPYISCDVSSQQSSPYVLTGDVVKSTNPGYIPFSQSEPAAKNPSYILAGMKSNGYIPFNQTEANVNKNTGYVVAGNKNCKLD